MTSADPVSRPAPLLTAVRRRPGVHSLDGEWPALIDPYRTGEFDLFGNPNGRGWHRGHRPRLAADGTVLPTDRTEYDFDAAPTLTVPGSWVGQRPELSLYEGSVWYQRRFTHRPVDDRRTIIRFGSANHDTRVWCNGVDVAHHIGGYGPFDVEVTDHLRSDGEQQLIVRVEAERTPDRVPATDTDWANDGGLTGHVDLVDVPATFLRTAWLQLDPSGDRLVGSVVVDGPEASGTSLVCRIDGTDVWAAPVPSAEAGLAEAGIDADVPDGLTRWSADDPVRHDVSWHLLDDAGREIDRLDDRVGFRTITTSGTRILLNGAPIMLRGIAIHADAPHRDDRACRDDDAATLLDWAQSLGVNFVRLSHYQHPEAMLEACDERGLLAWCELPVYWGIDWTNPNAVDSARSQLDELVIRDRNRASAIIWSVANETLPGPERNEFLRDLVARARAHDPTRLVSAALFVLPGSGEHETHHLDDPIAADLDVVGANNYFGWYYGDVDTTPSIVWTQDVERPLIMTEYGAGALAGNHGHDRARWTEEFQVAVYEAQYEMQRAIPFIAGTTPWALKDFRTPKRQLPGIQDGWNRKGVFGPNGEEKLVAEVVRRVYADWPDPAPAD